MNHARNRQVSITAVSPGETGTLVNLLQLYQYDFSEIEPVPVGADGRFHQLDDVPFEYAYFVHDNGELAGFVLVDRRPSHVIDGQTVWSMVEFFILRKHRRASVGATAAHLVIERHSGTWEITETPHNVAALSFWRQVLAVYPCEELSYDHPRHGRCPLQRFSV